jgi:hypothetical protein
MGKVTLKINRRLIGDEPTAPIEGKKETPCLLSGSCNNPKISRLYLHVVAVKRGR